MTARDLRRTVAALLTGCLLATGLFACDSDQPTGGKIKLHFWSMWRLGEPQQAVIAASIDAFEKKSGIDVETRWVGRGVADKIKAGAKVGKVPDLTDNSAGELLALSNAGLMTGLDSVFHKKLAGKSGRSVGDASPAKYVKPYRNAKGAAVVPYELRTTSLWFDGAAQPELAGRSSLTWTEFLAKLDELKAAGKTPLAADGADPDYNAYWITALVERYLGPNWLRKAAQDKTGKAWRDPKFLEAAKDVSKLVDGGYFMKDYQTSKVPAAQESWAEGDAAFLLMGSWAPTATEDKASDDFEYRAIPFPTVPGGSSSIEVNPIGFGIPAKAKHEKAAKSFIAYFMAKKLLSQTSLKADNLTTDPSIPAPKALEDVQSNLEVAHATHRPAAGVPVDFPDYWQTVFTPDQDELFFGTLDPEQYVAKLQQDSIAYWKAPTGPTSTPP